MMSHSMTEVFVCVCVSLYLVSKSLGWRIPNPAAMWHTHQLSAEFQDMSKWKVANIGVILTVTIKKTLLLTENPLPLSKQATTFRTILNTLKVFLMQK